MNSRGDEADRFGVLSERLHAFLSTLGVADPLGSGDFDICLDNYNNRDFYVLVNNISVIDSSWVGGIQAILRELGGEWLVHIRLGIPPEGDRPKFDCAGLEISADTVKELWNREELSQTFGEAFRFADSSSR